MTRLSKCHKMNNGKIPAWGIPIRYCAVGSLLQKIKGTPCNICYAGKGRFVFKSVQKILEKNYLDWLENRSDWVTVMVNLIKESNCSHFRFFHSGDIQGILMLQDIIEICKRLPKVYFWVPTQERILVESNYDLWKDIPNLCIRISSPRTGVETKSVKNIPTSFIIEKGKESCPAPKQEGQCKTCRMCWDRNIKVVSYRIH